jgi:hypothetical protein
VLCLQEVQAVRERAGLCFVAGRGGGGGCLTSAGVRLLATEVTSSGKRPGDFSTAAVAPQYVLTRTDVT